MKNIDTFWPTRNIDLTITYSIMKSFANKHQDSLPLAIRSHWDGVSEPTYQLPDWMQTIIQALKQIHGESYFAFALENTTNELLSVWTKQGLSEHAANQFKIAVRQQMQSKEIFH